jgi:DNA invertase Pin-like site-specific DNA recombinase
MTGQLEALKAAGCAQIFAEEYTGKAAADRKQLQALLAKVRQGDVIVVCKLDRFARSTRDLLNMLHDLEQRGVGFQSLGDSVDATTPAGRLMLQMLAAIAEFERGMIRERCAAGMAERKLKAARTARAQVGHSSTRPHFSIVALIDRRRAQYRSRPACKASKFRTIRLPSASNRGIGPVDRAL